MDVGSLRHRVTFQSPSRTSPTGYVEAVANVPAAIEAAGTGGNETLRFATPASAGQYKITVRHRTDVQADWRVIDEEDVTYQIAGYHDPDGRRERLFIFATTVQ